MCDREKVRASLRDIKREKKTYVHTVLATITPMDHPLPGLKQKFLRSTLCEKKKDTDVVHTHTRPSLPDPEWFIIVL